MEELKENIKTVADALWQKCYDGYFRGHAGVRSHGFDASYEGQPQTVIAGHLRMGKLLANGSPLFPFIMQTWWNNENKGSVLVSFRLTHSAAEGLAIDRMYIEKKSKTGSLLAEKEIMISALKDIPSKARLISMMKTRSERKSLKR